MAQGRRPDPFRTRKLRPGTAMVLHLEGCGRVARRRTQTLKGRGHHTCPLPFLYTRTQPPSHPRYPHTEQTGHTGTTPSHTPTMNRQRPHHTHDRHGIWEPKAIFRRSISSRMRLHTQPRRKAPGNDTIAWHPPARACPGIHNAPLPAYRANRAPASGLRRMSRHTHLKKLPGPQGKPGCTPRGRQGHGIHIRCQDTPTATTPAGITSNNPGSYMPQAHTKQTSHT